MSEFTIQFNQPNFNFRFLADGQELPFTVNQHSSVDHKQLLEQEKRVTSLLKSIQIGMAEIREYLKSTENDVKLTTINFAESFVRMIFKHDSELALEKVKKHLDDAFAKLEIPSPVKVWVNPQIGPQIQEHMKLQQVQNLEFDLDPLLAESDCRLEGPGTGWITRIENQLELCRQNLINNLESEHERI